ncbi:MAG: response regulator, partial [Candidatus Aminicenantes bacterium]|nr:response regulator [Candidatus Aminicenantes bacterium]
MNRTKILLVEDESIVARDIRNMLLGLGYKVSGVASTAREAVQKAEEMKPDIVLMDVMLKGGPTGVDAADKIYTHCNIPVVYLTAYADENTLQKAKKTEPFGYILKPFEEKELQTTIEVALYKFKMEMKLKNRERWLSTILKSIGDAVIATDQKGAVTFLNPLAEVLTGWKQEEALEKPLSSIFNIMNGKTRKPLKISVEKILQGNSLKNPNEAILISNAGVKT